MTGTTPEQLAACARGEHVRSGHTNSGGWAQSACVHCGAVAGISAGDPSPSQCPHGYWSWALCPQCTEQYSRQFDVQRPPMRIASYEPTSDARALLWAGTYAWKRKEFRGAEREREIATNAANEAIADFDEHYLGRAPSTKG